MRCARDNRQHVTLHDDRWLPAINRHAPVYYTRTCHPPAPGLRALSEAALRPSPSLAFQR